MSKKIIAWVIIGDGGYKDLALTDIHFSQINGWVYAVFRTKKEVLRFAKEKDVRKVEIKILK